MKALLTRIALKWLKSQGFWLDCTHNLASKPNNYTVTLNTIEEHPAQHNLFSGTLPPTGRTCDVILAIVPR